MSTNTDGSIKSYDTSSTEEIDQTLKQFTESTAELARALDAPESVLSDWVSSAEDLAALVQESAHTANAVDQRAADLEQELDEEKNKRSAEIEGCHNRINNVEQDIESSNPCTQADRTTIQDDDLTPIEQLSKAEEISEVTDSQSVQRAVSLFKNIDSWGSRTPKGIVLKPADNPLSLLEADQDESLQWVQYYRACESLEKLSHGAVTFFDSDRHGKMLVLHKQSEVFERVVGSHTTSLAENRGRS